MKTKTGYQIAHELGYRFKTRVTRVRKTYVIDLSYTGVKDGLITKRYAETFLGALIWKIKLEVALRRYAGGLI